MNRARIEVSFKLLENLLGLDAIKVVGAYRSHQANDAVCLIVESEQFDDTSDYYYELPAIDLIAGFTHEGEPINTWNYKEQ